MTYLYLDIDGVLNPFNDRTNLERMSTWQWPGETIGAFGVYVCQEAAEWLRGLPVEIVWATTWCNNPDALTAYADALGLAHDLRLELPPPPDEDLDADEWPNEDTWRDEDETCGKREGMKLWAAAHVPHEGVWVDDMLTHGDAMWAREHNIVPVRSHGARGLASPLLRAAIEAALR